MTLHEACAGDNRVVTRPRSSLRSRGGTPAVSEYGPDPGDVSRQLLPGPSEAIETVGKLPPGQSADHQTKNGSDAGDHDVSPAPLGEMQGRCEQFRCPDQHDGQAGQEQA